jgi:hypothetical protein
MVARKGKESPYQPSGEVDRIISLGGGTYAYVFDANGKTHHLRRDSDAMVAVCREADAAMGGRISAQLTRMGWTDVVERMSEDG